VKSTTGGSGVADSRNLAFTTVRTLFEDLRTARKRWDDKPSGSKASLPAGWPTTNQV